MEKRFSRAVSLIYDAAADPSLWPDALQAFADVFDDVGAVLIWRNAAEGFGTIVSPSLQHGQAEFERYWWKHDIRTLRGAEKLYAAEQDVLCDYDVVTQEEIDTHPIYTEFLPSLGIGWFGAASVAPEANVSLMVSVQRSRSKPPFTRQELAIVHELARHVEKAFRLSLRLFEAEALNLGLSEALRQADFGVIAVDAAGRVVFANDKARSALGCEQEEPLRLSSERARAALQLAIESYGAGAPGASLKPLLIEQAPSRPPLIAYCFPASRASAVDMMLTRARAMILLADAGTDEPPDPAFLRDTLGLTLGEARVAALIGRGMAPKAAAERLGIAESTARTVLKRVFIKIGVSRQSELTAFLNRIATFAAGKGNI
ncbi:helix-turn-helix transcriptional regulator [Methylocystis parvus]|uniref:helix-turn-helix transcriptional regulator n=1 Tax=Methylocystis parvus TaxID=134 RepID=UPI003C735681